MVSAQHDEGVITNLDPEFIKEYYDDIVGRVPEEKVKAELRQQQTARIMRQAGSLCVEGLGQKVASIDARLFFRMMHSFGHQETWLQDFLADNPQLCAPGYKPKRKGDLRHSVTFSDGKPVGKGKITP